MSTQTVQETRFEEQIAQQLYSSVNALVSVANTVHAISILREKARNLQKVINKTEEYQAYLTASKKYKEKLEAFKASCPEYQEKVVALQKVQELKDYQDKKAILKEMARLRKRMFEDALKAYDMLPPEWKVQ
jgi:cell fate (sporulation/competence/biofilm development) regulator YlbF (YheA/YmcA/DUF963 family)